MKVIRCKSVLLSCAISLMYTSGIVASFISLLTLALCGHHLTPFIVFTLLSIINVLRNSALRSIGEGTMFVYEAYVSFQRIQEFLMLQNLCSLTDVKPLTKLTKNASPFENEEFEDIINELACFEESLKKSNDINIYRDDLESKNKHNLLGIKNLEKINLKKHE